MATSTQNTDEANYESDQVPHWILAKRGIKLLINNNGKEAEELFTRYPDSLIMFAGYSFATFMDALMTFEDDKLCRATSVLKEVERRCTSETGWIKSMKKVFGSRELHQSHAENLETQIILADSQVCLAILTFLQHDISGYFKGSWVLRKAWKVYHSAFYEISRLYKEIVGDQDLPDLRPVSGSSMENFSSTSTASRDDKPEESPPPSNGYKFPHSYSQNLPKSSQTSSMKKSRSVNSALFESVPQNWSAPLINSLSVIYLSSPSLNNIFNDSHQKTSGIDKETITRLMGAVSFGYGLFQLGISLLPPSLLKLTHFFGIGHGSSRQNGINCLMYARNGVDMRAPLATLSLLWYHTIVRPFYALDGANVQAGVTAAWELIMESDEEYGQSALFLFFRGRVHRLNSDIDLALKAFQNAVDNAPQREIKILSLHEVGWCHLIQLDYCPAESNFSYLKSWSRWSRAFYSYLTGICAGACADQPNVAILKEIASNIASSGGGARNSQLDEFLSRRAKCCPSNEEVLSNLNPNFWRLLVYEMLYLWNALPSCSADHIELMRSDCVAVNEHKDREPMLGIARLILGSCCLAQKNYGESVEAFKECLKCRKDMAHNAMDAHISAFSHYEIGCLLIKSQETREEGRAHLHLVSSYKDFDFEHRLNVRVHSLLKQL